jgi:hypothetical protein
MMSVMPPNAGTADHATGRPAGINKNQSNIAGTERNAYMFITANFGKGTNKGSASIDYDIGGNLGEALKLFGEPEVYATYARAMIIAVQARMRRLVKEKYSEQEIQTLMTSWKPGTKIPRTKTDLVVRTFFDDFVSSPPERQRAIKAEFEAWLTAKPPRPPE